MGLRAGMLERREGVNGRSLVRDGAFLVRS